MNVFDQRSGCVCSDNNRARLVSRRDVTILCIPLIAMGLFDMLPGNFHSLVDLTTSQHAIEKDNTLYPSDHYPVQVCIC